MDANDKLDRLEGKFDKMLLLMENMNKDISELKQGQERIEKHLEKHDGQLAAIAEAINATNQNLTSKIDMLDKNVDILEGRTNVNTIDINKLRAANRELTSNIDTLDKKVAILEGQTNINSLDIVKLRAAK